MLSDGNWSRCSRRYDAIWTTLTGDPRQAVVGRVAGLRIACAISRRQHGFRSDRQALAKGRHHLVQHARETLLRRADAITRAIAGAPGVAFRLIRPVLAGERGRRARTAGSH